MHNNNYKTTIFEIYETIAEDFFRKYQLTPNFDIIKLLNELEIEVISIKELPGNWEYAFNTELGKLKIYYRENLLYQKNQHKNSYTQKEIEEYQSNLEFSQRDLRFVLAIALADLLAFYRLEENSLIKRELNGITYFKGGLRHLQSIEEKDRECEVFAANLLMPRDVITNKFYETLENNQNNFTYDDLWDFGLSFGVNPRAIHRRCKVLKLISN